MSVQLRVSLSLLAFSALGALGLAALTLTASDQLGRKAVADAARSNLPGIDQEATGTAHADQASIVIPSGTKHDFGRMLQGKTGTHSFHVRNGGSKHLELELLSTSCGCTTVKIDGNRMRANADFNEDFGLSSHPLAPPKDLALGSGVLETKLTQELELDKDIQADLAVNTHTVGPGETARLELTWETRMNSGPFRQTARVKTSDPENPTVEFVIEGEVVALAEVSQSQVVFPNVRVCQGAEHTVYVFSKLRDDLEIVKAESSSKIVRVELQPATAKKLREMGWMSGYRAVIAVSADLPVGHFFEEVTFKTNIPELSDLHVLVEGEVKGGLRLMTDRVVDFGPVSAEEGASRTVFAVSDRHLAVEAEFKQVVPEFLKCEIDSAKARAKGDELLIVSLSIPRDAPEGPFMGVIELGTTHPGAKRFVIPVRGEIQR